MLSKPQPFMSQWLDCPNNMSVLVNEAFGDPRAWALACTLHAALNA
jgi:hypothetical protein